MVVALEWLEMRKEKLNEKYRQTLKGRFYNYVPPTIRGDSRPMSENTINVALAAIGFKNEMVGHGWRSAHCIELNQSRYIIQNRN